MNILINILTVIGAYLLGSIPSAVWIGKKFYGIDIREHGSKNAGATNMLRVLGKKAAAPVFAIDAAKGYLAVMLSHFSSFDSSSESFMILRIVLIAAAILGHIFPIFAGFKGGKGVATIAGCLIAMSPYPLLACFIVFLVIFVIFHYVSLGSIAAAILFPLFTFVKFRIFHEPISPTMMIFSVIVAAMLLITHRKNFKRILTGTESKTYIFKKKSK